MVSTSPQPHGQGSLTLNHWKRRAVTIPVLVLSAGLAAVLFIPVLLLCLVISLHPRLRTLPHVWTFVCGYLAYEVLGVTKLTWVWLRYRRSPDWVYQNRLVQIWWACGLMDLGAFIFRLNFEVTGTEALEGPSAILFVRHASLGDTVLPLKFFSEPRQCEGIRYLIKKELRMSPSLDIGAHRLSTVFVDRSGTNTQAELSRIADMVRSTPDDESIMIYPEGTRVTAARRAQIQARHPDLTDQLERWPDLLPPRLGGVTTLLTHNPGKDVVFIAHTGFEGLANLTELLSGSWRHTTVRIHLWRVANADIPKDYQAFIFEHWDNMQRVVQEHKTLQQ